MNTGRSTTWGSKQSHETLEQKSLVDKEARKRHVAHQQEKSLRANQTDTNTWKVLTIKGLERTKEKLSAASVPCWS
jgi:hypothetical protein